MPLNNYQAVSICEKLCQLLSCLLFISIPMTTMLLLYKSNASSSKTLTVVMAAILCFLAICLIVLALIKIFYKPEPSAEQQTRINTRANAGMYYKHSAIASLVDNSVIVNGRILVPYKITDLELQLNSLNNIL